MSMGEAYLTVISTKGVTPDGNLFLVLDTVFTISFTSRAVSGKTFRMLPYCMRNDKYDKEYVWNSRFCSKIFQIGSKDKAKLPWYRIWLALLSTDKFGILDKICVTTICFQLFRI